MSKKTNIKIVSAITPDLLNVAYTALNSVKQNKKSTTELDYYLFIKYTFSQDEYYCKRYIDDLSSDDFKIHYIDANPYTEKIKPQKGSKDIVYLRCLLPKIFNDFDKILHLDIDVFCLKEGIENLWNMSLDDVYVKATRDYVVTYSPDSCYDYYNTQTQTYFNAGVMLLNLAKIREDELDNTLEEWTRDWNKYIINPILFDQTILNYFFRKHIDILPITWNNTIFSCTNVSIEYVNNALIQEGYDIPINSIKDTVFVHFCNKSKPWDNSEMLRGKARYPYIEEELDLWNEIKTKYEKRN